MKICQRYPDPHRRAKAQIVRTLSGIATGCSTLNTEKVVTGQQQPCQAPTAHTSRPSRPRRNRIVIHCRETVALSQRQLQLYELCPSNDGSPER